MGAGVLRRLQLGQRVLVRPVVKIANQPASRADLPRLRQVVLPYKALKGLPGQARQLGSDFFGDDLGERMPRRYILDLVMKSPLKGGAEASAAGGVIASCCFLTDS